MSAAVDHIRAVLDELDASCAVFDAALIRGDLEASEAAREVSRALSRELFALIAPESVWVVPAERQVYPDAETASDSGRV